MLTKESFRSGFFLASLLCLASAAESSDALHATHGMGTGPVVAEAEPAAISAQALGKEVAGRPFADPPLIRSRNKRLDVKLIPTATPVTISGKRVNARVYGVSAFGRHYPPAFMPPTLVVDPGDNLKVWLINKLGEPTNLHTHGFFVSPMGNQDNIFVDLSQQRQFLYNYFLPPQLEPGSYWYHPHYHPLVEEQVFGGLSGFIYVRGLENLLPVSLQGISQHFLGLKDYQVNARHTIPKNNINSDAPTTRTINGQVQPVLTLKPGETQLWHIGNLSADIWYHLAMPGFTFTVIGEDANPVDRTWSASTLLMPPAKRFDVLVQATNPGTHALKTLEMSTGPAGDNYPETLLATVKVKGRSQSPAQLPETIKPMDDLSKAVITRQRVFTLTEDNTGFFINGSMFNANQVDATPVIGTVEEWVFRNATQEMHPIHIHVNDAQIMSVNGVAQTARSWVDTFPIPYAGTANGGTSRPGEVVVRIKFRQFVGPYVFHCHILAHEDQGMMTIINVTSPNSE
jgi:FtsP/CotA-like multicopper oxidase with cupredoxin domain